jgi:hypothetical protein
MEDELQEDQTRIIQQEYLKMNAFIVRPFGEKNGINFDRVESDLIRPALQALKIPGGTTGLLAYAGNIRTDMFEQLLLADLVVADISIHNANVFYELGVRHGLRDMRTFLIRSQGDEVPFDLRTDRYLEYDKANPAATLDKLVEGLKATVDSAKSDSPVFQLLPKLRPPAREQLLTLPEDFELDVRRARESKDAGLLAIMTAEITNSQWKVEGTRAIGKALFQLKAHRDAAEAWEEVRKSYPDDVEANLLLGTIYERLQDLVASDLAMERALDRLDLTPEQRAEGYALLGRNAKRRWQQAWEPTTDPAVAALQSDSLVKAQEQYARGFSEDQNHFFSGLNALALLTVRLELARSVPQTWDFQFDSSEEAKARFETLEKERARLAAAVDVSLEAASSRLERRQKEDIWLDFSKADFKCLTLKNSARVGAAYRSIVDRADPFACDSARKQLLIYQKLGVLSENVKAALDVLASKSSTPTKAETLHLILFTGHQIDAPNREQPRFPPDRESIARARIKEKLQAEISGLKGDFLGIAGAASGGDILFHEVCSELGIKTHVYLALPDNMFINESVAPADADWVQRFRKLLDGKNRKTEVRQLADSKAFPKWLQAQRPPHDFWGRNNLWMLHNAIALGGKNTILVALWNQAGGDGEGGTADMVEKATQWGARTIIIDTKKEFGV